MYIMNTESTILDLVDADVLCEGGYAYVTTYDGKTLTPSEIESIEELGTVFLRSTPLELSCTEYLFRDFTE